MHYFNYYERLFKGGLVIGLIGIIIMAIMESCN